MSGRPAKPLMLIVDDEPSVRVLLEALGGREGFDVISCGSGADGIDILRRRHVDLMFLDLNMPGVDGLEVLKATRRIAGAAHIVLITGFGSIDSAVEAVKLGAEDYLLKPLDLPRIREVMRSVRHQFETRGNIQAADVSLATQLEFCGMIGRSPVILELFDLVRRLAPHARAVLITGETGSGKELVSRALHRLGPRRDRKFITVNCSAIVETLVESELFGHVRGAFTGATESKAGLFEAADGGTLFLDEVGELPAGTQAKLLRVLETGEVQRVGAVEPRRVDVRVIAATNRDLVAEAHAGRFRNDLYHRLSVVELLVPPLRERLEDVPYLAAAFLREFATRFDKSISGMTPHAEALLAGPWPGNVRQLRNVMERACLLCEGHLLTEGDLTRAVGPRHSTRTAVAVEAPSPAPAPAKENVIQALAASRGNKARAARRLSVSRRALYRLIDKYDLDHGFPSGSNPG